MRISFVEVSSPSWCERFYCACSEILLHYTIGLRSLRCTFIIYLFDSLFIRTTSVVIRTTSISIPFIFSTCSSKDTHGRSAQSRAEQTNNVYAIFKISNANRWELHQRSSWLIVSEPCFKWGRKWLIIRAKKMEPCVVIPHGESKESIFGCFVSCLI